MFDPKKPDYRFAGEGGGKPLIIQEGRIYDINGNSLDEQFLRDNTAENLIAWLYKKGYSITPEARAIIIREKRRVALQRQAEELQRQNEKLIAEETARIEAQLMEAEAEMRSQVDLHLTQPEEERPPLPLTAVEREVLGLGTVDANEIPDPPGMEELAPKEMDELQGLVRTKADKNKPLGASAKNRSTKTK